jgi:hypothetical protein
MNIKAEVVANDNSKYQSFMKLKSKNYIDYSLFSFLLNIYKKLKNNKISIEKWSKYLESEIEENILESLINNIDGEILEIYETYDISEFVLLSLSSFIRGNSNQLDVDYCFLSFFMFCIYLH